MAVNLLLVRKTEDDRGNECYYPEGEYTSMKEAKAALNALDSLYDEHIYQILEIRAEFAVESFKALKLVKL